MAAAAAVGLKEEKKVEQPQRCLLRGYISFTKVGQGFRDELFGPIRTWWVCCHGDV